MDPLTIIAIGAAIYLLLVGAGVLIGGATSNSPGKEKVFNFSAVCKEVCDEWKRACVEVCSLQDGLNEARANARAAWITFGILVGSSCATAVMGLIASGIPMLAALALALFGASAALVAASAIALGIAFAAEMRVNQFRQARGLAKDVRDRLRTTVSSACGENASQCLDNPPC